MSLRKTVRDVHRRGTENYAVVEGLGVDTATVRLSVGGARLTNLAVVSRVAVGDRVIVDYSMGDKPYVRPVTLSDEEEVLDLADVSAAEITQVGYGTCWRLRESTPFTLHGNAGDESYQGEVYYTPNFDDVVWGDPGAVQIPDSSIFWDSPRYPYNKKALSIETPGKYMASYSYNLRVSNFHGCSYSPPFIGGDLFMYMYFREIQGGIDYFCRQNDSYPWFKDKNDVKSIHNCGILVIENPNTIIWPFIFFKRPYNWSSKTGYFYPSDTSHIDLEFSNLVFDFMLIAELSPKPRSTYYSHWSEWYEKYP